MTSQTVAQARPIPHWNWLNNPLAFTVCSPLVSIMGAATTIVAPILLDPISFGKYAILVGIFQYIADFDLGLSRLSDRLLTRPGDDTKVVMDTLLAARLIVATGIAVIAIIAGLFTQLLTVITVFAGVAMMLSNGPIAIYRARSQIAAFTLSSVGTQFGMSLPRLSGLLIGGVRGCIVAFAIWYGSAAIILYLPFVRELRVVKRQRLLRLFGQSIPLFVLSSSWLFYLLASRWVSWAISSPTEAGFFAFGANLVLTGWSVIGTISQAHYPRHLLLRDKTRLCRELRLLLVVATICCILANIFCRFALGRVFPHFASADACTAAILFSGIPLGLNTWLIPLVIARIEKPILHAFFMFGFTVASLYGLMSILYRFGGVEGEAWGCIPPALILLAFQLHHVVREGLLSAHVAIRLWLGGLVIEGVCALIWSITFH